MSKPSSSGCSLDFYTYQVKMDPWPQYFVSQKSLLLIKTMLNLKLQAMCLQSLLSISKFTSVKILFQELNDIP